MSGSRKSTRKSSPLSSPLGRGASVVSDSATLLPTPQGRSGARLYQGVEVTGLIHGGSSVTGIKTTAGDITAGQVVLAAGPWSGIGGRWSAPGGPLDLPVRGVKGQRILLRRPGRMPKTPVRNSAVYVVPRLDGNILVASTREEGRSDQTLTAEGVSTLISNALLSFPSLARRRLCFRSCGCPTSYPRRAPNHRPRSRHRGPGRRYRPRRRRHNAEPRNR